jgi:hypothetical protein
MLEGYGTGTIGPQEATTGAVKLKNYPIGVAKLRSKTYL